MTRRRRGREEKHGEKRDPLVTERVTVSSTGAKNLLHRGNPVLGRSLAAQWMDSTCLHVTPRCQIKLVKECKVNRATSVNLKAGQPI
jgi:hypothetical protein